MKRQPRKCTKRTKTPAVKRWSVYALSHKTGMDERTIRRHLSALGLYPPQLQPPMRVWWALEELPAFKAAQHRLAMSRWQALYDRALAEEGDRQ